MQRVLDMNSRVSVLVCASSFYPSQARTVPQDMTVVLFLFFLNIFLYIFVVYACVCVCMHTHECVYACVEATGELLVSSSIAL